MIRESYQSHGEEREKAEAAALDQMIKATQAEKWITVCCFIKDGCIHLLETTCNYPQADYDQTLKLFENVLQEKAEGAMAKPTPLPPADLRDLMGLPPSEDQKKDSYVENPVGVVGDLEERDPTEVSVDSLGKQDQPIGIGMCSAECDTGSPREEIGKDPDASE
jgi:hypothetical protein